MKSGVGGHGAEDLDTDTITALTVTLRLPAAVGRLYAHYSAEAQTLVVESELGRRAKGYGYRVTVDESRLVFYLTMHRELCGFDLHVSRRDWPVTRPRWPAAMEGGVAGAVNANLVFTEEVTMHPTLNDIPLRLSTDRFRRSLLLLLGSPRKPPLWVKISEQAPSGRHDLPLPVWARNVRTTRP